MDEVPEEELEGEMGRADEVQEQLELAIMEADGVLRSRNGDLAPATSVSGADCTSLEPPTASAVTSIAL